MVNYLSMKNILQLQFIEIHIKISSHKNKPVIITIKKRHFPNKSTHTKKIHKQEVTCNFKMHSLIIITAF